MKSSFAVSSDVSLKSFCISNLLCYSMGQGVLVAHSFFVVSTIQLHCNELVLFASGSMLEKLED